MNRLRTGTYVAAAVLIATGAAAQQPAPAAGAPPQAVSAQPSAVPPGQGTAAPAQPGSYTYSVDGRRDPFISLVGRGSETRATGSRPAGLPGLLINEISVKGILRDRSGFAAMVQGPDNKTYVVKPGDRLMDGTVKSILPDAVVFSQDVNDPLSLVKQREIRKSLRSSEESRG